MTLPTNEGPTRSFRPAPTLTEEVDSSGRDRETRRELAKLTANYFNAVATSIFAIGALAPLAALASGQLVVRDAGWVVGLVVLAFALSLVAHLGARYVLRREFRR